MVVVGQWLGKEWQEAMLPQIKEYWRQQIAAAAHRPDDKPAYEEMDVGPEHNVFADSALIIGDDGKRYRLDANGFTLHMNRWMHPAIWWLLLIAAPPVWFFLIFARFASEILAALGVVVIAVFGFWIVATMLIAMSPTEWKQDANASTVTKSVPSKIIYEKIDAQAPRQ